MHVAIGFRTKAELKAAVKEGRRVSFRDTSLFAPRDYTSDDLDRAIYLVGPGEYERKWYAQVKRVNGKVTVV